MINLDELERLAREATPGEWYADMAVSINGYETRAVYVNPTNNHVLEIIETVDDVQKDDCIHNEADWRYIASANPETVLKLIAELRTLRNVATAAHQMLLTVDDEGYLPRFGIDEALAEWRKLGGGE